MTNHTQPPEAMPEDELDQVQGGLILNLSVGLE